MCKVNENTLEMIMIIMMMMLKDVAQHPNTPMELKLPDAGPIGIHQPVYKKHP